VTATTRHHLLRVFAVMLAVSVLAAACSDGGSSTSGESGNAPSGNDDSASVDVYSFAGGCFNLVDETTGGSVRVADDGWTVGGGIDDEVTSEAAAFWMQATALGRYLLYGSDGEMVAAVGTDGVAITTEPGPSADWTLSAGSSGLTVTNLVTELDLGVGDDQRLVQSATGDDGNARWSLVEATGCDPFPDISPGAIGEPFVGDSPDAPVRGFLDAHTHVSAFSFLSGALHCGRPWSPYGVTVALVDCPDHIDGGVGVIVESLFSNGSFDDTHATDGWPTFEGWPQPGSLTHEGTYWRWIERAWRGGLRLMVNDLVDNRALCELYPLDDGTECGDMANVGQQAEDMTALQDYIDAQFGGPGEGFFRLVSSPEEAREVINDGKLAVVLGVEVSEVLECGLNGAEPLCDEAQIDAGLDELYELGVRSLFPIHKFDNALGGTKYDGGIQGILVNAGNRHVTGEWWSPGPCEEGAETDNTVISPEGTISLFVDPVVDVFGDTVAPILEGELPTYGPEPHCNARGLTDLGRYLINGMIDRNMIVETDHMSALARTEAFDLLEERNYPGVITSHGWGDATSQQRLVELGGVVSPDAGSLPGFVDTWREVKDAAPEEFHFGLGFGSDTNGLGGQPGPRGENEENPVVYPYETFDGATIMEQQVSGDRTFDINVDGVAHYGLFPDWVEDMRVIAGDEIVDDMAQGAEAYLQMWERAEAYG
jgi:microsomal dipeptidase-like Zn-dependent dipeptidase